MSGTIETITVLGGGAWGTALAQTAHRAGRAVTLWARAPEVIRKITETRENPDYLPNIPLDPRIRATSDMAQALSGAQAVLVVCPAQAVRSVLTTASDHWPAMAPAVLCAKGVEQGTMALMGEVCATVLPSAPIAVLSGPTFAKEVAEGRPTAVTLACTDPLLAEALVAALGTRSFRPYASTDVIGAEVGGAVKNVLAIACGVVEGLGLGDNARAALLTRGLAEIIRLGRSLGARPETLSGLSGMGDLILTATSMQSRNYSLGQALGTGRRLDAILAERKSVAEGVFSASAVVALAREMAVDMPICQAVNALVTGAMTVTDAVDSLLSRPLRPESDDV
ncbi:MAG: NAD(P)-dependent glycerol-3-phosphate dehydrogenase [Rhodospirillum sp.]|nr:NAD(P)-dependent glycerol-3-phosphate dehydrogenase [Rhodospirillum sp.]MCF8487666.1 NAD(P)-dependent glycerol-3-phosphate dehydrogenase [Rhodospirillum sp.]MCF8500411.1 NAD(P)-dependent glycerol-3-phosphate dehydrogenase [Rhodospirillum sp.]